MKTYSAFGLGFGYASSGRRPSPPLRQDAQCNIERIRAAAVEVFREQGLDASHEVIVKRAQVSAGTVYRRFPDRKELIDAPLGDELEVVADAERALAAPDAWDRLVALLEHLWGRRPPTSASSSC